jgi:hypothetical protein
MLRVMKKPVRRDPKPSRPLVPLDRAALERVSAGHGIVDPIAGTLQAYRPDDIASSND